MNSHKENGAALEILVIGIAIIVAMGLIAWRYIEADKAQNDVELSLASQSVSAPPNTTLPLRDIGLKIRVTSAMTQSFGTLMATKVGTAYEIHSLKLAKAEWQCEGENTGLLGTIKGASDGTNYSINESDQRNCLVKNSDKVMIDDFKAALPAVLQPIQ